MSKKRILVEIFEFFLFQFVVYVAPLSGIFVMNMYILYKVRQSHKELSSFNHTSPKINTVNGRGEGNVDENGQMDHGPGITQQNTKDQHRQEAEFHLTRMLLLITTSFILFTTPSFVRWVRSIVRSFVLSLCVNSFPLFPDFSAISKSFAEDKRNKKLLIFHALGIHFRTVYSFNPGRRWRLNFFELPLLSKDILWTSIYGLFHWWYLSTAFLVPLPLCHL